MSLRRIIQATAIGLTLAAMMGCQSLPKTYRCHQPAGLIPTKQSVERYEKNGREFAYDNRVYRIDDGCVMIIQAFYERKNNRWVENPFRVNYTLLRNSGESIIARENSIFDWNMDGRFDYETNDLKIETQSIPPAY